MYEFILSIHFQLHQLFQTCLMLKVPGKYKLDFSLPMKIDVDNSNAKFIKDQKVLLITAPIEQ